LIRCKQRSIHFFYLRSDKMEINFHFCSSLAKITFSLFLAFGCISFLLPFPAQAISISARISDQSTEVSGGDRLYFEVEIKYPENPQRKDLRLEYQIIKPDPAGTPGNGEIIASEKVLRAVETQISFLDYIVVPKSTQSGTYNLQVIVTDYSDLHKEVSATFKVTKGQDQIVTYFFILIGAMLLVAVLVIIQIISANRHATKN